jgi:hypothetical protein
VKEKDIINGEEPERINSEVFGSFHPDDESWLVGGSRDTFTSSLTFTPSGSDGAMDYDWIVEIEEANGS